MATESNESSAQSGRKVLLVIWLSNGDHVTLKTSEMPVVEKKGDSLQVLSESSMKTIAIDSVDKVTLEDAVVTANSYSREYGDANPVFEYTTEGAALDGDPEIICEATDTSSVGTYDIVVKQGSVKNYNVNYVAGKLTVTKAPLNIAAWTYTPSLYIHDNKNFESGFVWKIKDCVLEHKHSGFVPLLVQSLGSNVEGIVEIENLDMGVDLPVIFCDVNVNNSITRIKGTADYPIGYKTRATDTGLVLKVTSKATGGAGGIRFDESSSAFNDLISSDKGTTEYKE